MESSGDAAACASSSSTCDRQVTSSSISVASIGSSSWRPSWSSSSAIERTRFRQTAPTPVFGEMVFRSCPLVRTRRNTKLADSSRITTARKSVLSSTRQGRAGSSSTMPPAASATDSCPSTTRPLPSSSASISTVWPPRRALPGCGSHTCGDELSRANTESSAELRADT